MLYTNNIIDKLEQQAKDFPHKIAIIETTGRTTTFQSLVNDSLTLATNLASAGFTKGQKVLILVRPGAELATFILAILRLGGVAVVTDPDMGNDVFKSRVRASNPEWVFGESIIFALRHHPILKFILRKLGHNIPSLPILRGIQKIRVGWTPSYNLFSLSYKKLLRPNAQQPAAINRLTHESPALIIFTSGTTSQPKAVVHTIGSVEAMLEKITQIIQPGEKDIFNTSLPQFLLLSICLGVTAVVQKEKFAADEYLKMLQKYKPTILFGPPSEFIQLVNFCRQQATSLPPFIQKIFLGSAPVLSGFLKKLIQYVPTSTEITAIYGMTEMLPICAVNGREKAQWQGQGDLLGSIVDSVHYSIAADRELSVSGPHMCNHYLGQPPLTSIATGDLVREDRGQFVLIGRKKNMIIKGNYNIYPELYESTIQKIPGVAACAMFGIRDESAADEKIILAIEPEDMGDAFIAGRVATAIKNGGQYSIDAPAFPDKIIIRKMPRTGRQQKINIKILQQEAIR